uniref:Uncharacterized protein n=1 Tax=Arundo donax TaxID=35708 RepID=A0A0A9HK21_ARUDO
MNHTASANRSIHMMGFMLLVPSKEPRSNAHDCVHIEPQNLKV